MVLPRITCTYALSYLHNKYFLFIIDMDIYLLYQEKYEELSHQTGTQLRKLRVELSCTQWSIVFSSNTTKNKDVEYK